MAGYSERISISFPDLFAILMFILLDQDKISMYTQLQMVIPRLSLIYGIMMQTKNQSLSRIQRITSLLLLDNICDQKVFDRLQRLGVCLSYNRSIRLQEIIGGSFNDQLIDMVKTHRRFRIVGDNINWSVGVDDERADRKGHMEHAFGSLVIVQNTSFDHLPDLTRVPQFTETDYNIQYIPSVDDMADIRKDYVVLVSRVAFEHIPYLKTFQDVVPKYASTPCSENLKAQNLVIPLPVILENEQKHSDVVNILDFYEDVVMEAYTKAGRNPERIHIGGDQLTKERFSTGKCLRGYHQNPKERFAHLSPITFELFHMNMNFLTIIFKELYNNESGADIGTLKSLKDRIARTNVKAEVKTAYNQDRDFFVSVADVYIIECLLTHFGMEDVLSVPTKNVPPNFTSSEEKRQWFFETINDMLQTFVFSKKDLQVTTDQSSVEVEGLVKTIILSSGKSLQLMLKPAMERSNTSDRVKAYSKQLLQLGLLFKNILDFECMPERERGLRIFKLLMLYLKSYKNLSKYALEILRLLVHQLSLLSERKAHEEFYGLFVNTKGQYNGHIPVDLRMEFHVKEVKKHIKHMASNKTHSNISNRTKAISCIREISDNYDTETSVVKRSKKHRVISSFQDEHIMLEDLRKIRPFKNIPGRAHACFPNISDSIVDKLDVEHYRQWINSRIIKFTFELGN